MVSQQFVEAYRQTMNDAMIKTVRNALAVMHAFIVSTERIALLDICCARIIATCQRMTPTFFLLSSAVTNTSFNVIISTAMLHSVSAVVHSWLGYHRLLYNVLCNLVLPGLATFE